VLRTKQRRMESEPWCEARPVARSARSVLSYVRTHRSERWRIAPWIRLQALLFRCAGVFRELTRGAEYVVRRRRLRARRTSVPRQQLFVLPVFVAFFVGACSVMVDADRVQCVSDQDCTGRGAAFASSICENAVCRVATCKTGLVCDGESSRPRPDASVPRDAGRDGGRNPGADAGRDARIAVDASEGPTQDPISGDIPNSPIDSPQTPDAGVDEVPTAECERDTDCVALGKETAMCVDSVCWTPGEVNQCTEDPECGMLGPEYVGGKCVSAVCRPNPRWRCERPIEVSPTQLVKLEVLVRSSLSLAPIKDIRALVCDKLDLTCASPLAELDTGSSGILRFEVPASFAGYIQFDDPEWVPALYFLPNALPADGVLQPAPLMPNGVVDALAVSIGSRIDDTRGHMMLIAEDCYGAALPGVTFASPVQDSKTIQFYVRDLLPTTSAKETAEIGNGGYLNFPPGNAVITLTLNKSKLRLTTSSVVVRPGYITVAYLRPELR